MPYPTTRSRTTRARRGRPARRARSGAAKPRSHHKLAQLAPREPTALNPASCGRLQAANAAKASWDAHKESEGEAAWLAERSVRLEADLRAAHKRMERLSEELLTKEAQASCPRARRARSTTRRQRAHRVRWSACRSRLPRRRRGAWSLSELLVGLSPPCHRHRPQRCVAPLDEQANTLRGHDAWWLCDEHCTKTNSGAVAKANLRVPGRVQGQDADRCGVGVQGAG
jgi:hypothetical protein